MPVPVLPHGNGVTYKFQPLEVSVTWENNHWAGQLIVQHLLFPNGQGGDINGSHPVPMRNKEMRPCVFSMETVPGKW